jgi:hypothetical protein
MFHSRHLRAVLPFWIALLVIGSFLPADTKRALGTRSGEGSWGEPATSHRVWHIASFGSTALLTTLVAQSPGARLLAAGGLFGLAVSIELLQQQIVFGSDLEWWDIRDDGYGIIALTIAGWIGRVRRVLLKAGRK